MFYKDLISKQNYLLKSAFCYLGEILYLKLRISVNSEATLLFSGIFYVFLSTDKESLYVYTEFDVLILCGSFLERCATFFRIVGYHI